MTTHSTHSTSSVDDCRIVRLDKHHHENGNLTVVDNGADTPFTVKRVYYLYDVPAGEKRGGHSHHESLALIVAVSGSFDVSVDDGVNKKNFTLNRPNSALYLTPGIWRVLDNFSSGSVCLVLTSTPFSEDDYVRDYDQFLELTACKRVNQSS